MKNSYTTIIGKIEEGIKAAQAKEIDYKELFSSAALNGKNEFLFFIKPEITLDSADINLRPILELILSKIQEFNFEIVNIKILSASYLDKHDIIARHYGVINKISRNAGENLSELAKDKFYQLFGKKVEQVTLLGSLEFLKEYPEFSPLALDHLWQNAGFEKLAGGTYVQQLKLDGEEVFLINGFHPRQLVHFTNPGRSIVTFTLKSDTDWDIARGRFIGATDPSKAEKGSIRNELLNNKEKYGLSTVSSSWNGVHLSAGPVEGLVELIRYNSNYNVGDLKSYADYSLGKLLLENFPGEQVDNILNNINVNYQSTEISVFDLTEEKNSEEAIDLLKQII